MADKWIHGSAVDKETGKLRYLSPSGMQLADMATDQGCLRKWYYAYKEGKKEPSTQAQIDGTKDHAVVENYLITGQRVFSPRAAKGLHMLPPPGPHLHVEHDLVPPHPDDPTGQVLSGLEFAPLRAAGIPIVGRIDLLHDLGVNYGADSVEETKDPEGTIEVADHKFVKSLAYAKKGPELLKTIQMTAYGEYVFTVTPGAQFVRLSHLYYPTNGNARKATVRTDREPIHRYWAEHVEPLARSIIDAAKEPSADTVPANTRACRAFNRECMHAPYCGAGMQGALAGLVGQTAAQGLLNEFSKNKKDQDMALIPGKSLLAHIKNAAPASPPADKEAEIAKLKAEEEEAKLMALAKTLAPAVNAIRAFDKGTPNLSGMAATVYARITGSPPPEGGSGDLAAVEVSDPNAFTQILEEMRAMFAVEPESVGLLPDDAPMDVPAPAPVPAAATPVTTTPTEAVAPVEKKSKATKTLKAKAEPVAEVPAPAPAPAPVVTEAVYVPVTEVNTDAKVILLVDTINDNVQGAKNFAVVIDTLTAAMAKRFNLDDCRLGDNQSPLGYGKWKGVLASMLRETMPNEPGTYYLDARGNEIYEEAANAMRDVCRRTGGYWVRGTGR